MLMINCIVLLAVLASFCYGQILQNGRFRRFPMKAAMKLRNRLKEKLDQVRERNTQLICYDIVGCFNLPHKNSPLQKVPEDPKMLDTKFYLFTRNINFSHPEVLMYDDNGLSLDKSSFNYSKPLKLLVHGYMGRWNDKAFLVLSEAYIKLYDCNVVVMDWQVGARGPQYTNAAANTELVGRQLGMLLELMVEKGVQPRDMHLIGFSLGAHVCGTASEALKVKGYLVGRITGLDAASPLFRNNYLREKYKKLDRSDAKFVDVIHTDASPFVTDGFGLWQPIGHVDFFPNGGQEQPGCTDTKRSIVVTHFEGGLSRDIACSHLRAFFLYTESVLNMLRKKENKDVCEFTSFTCPGGLKSFEKGHCFPHIEKNSTLVLDPSYLTNIGRFGEDARGEGVMYFSTKDSSQYCGEQLQASAIISQKTGHIKGILQLYLHYLNYSVNFNIKCDTAHGTIMNALAVADYGSLTSDVDSLAGILHYHDMGQEKNRRNQTEYASVLYIDKLIVRDMFGNSWQYCKRETIVQDSFGSQIAWWFQFMYFMDLYNIIKQLGKGTYGTIHLCERKHNQQKIVVKQINTDLQGEQLQAAKNEVAILKSLNHPNIIQYYDSFIKSGTFYIVMEFACKGSLYELIYSSRPNYFSAQHVMNLFCQILMGLDHIHEKKVIHRDLKCENIFLTGLKGDVVKIGDFGISKTLVNNNMANTIIGTCNYLAPELCDGKPYNSKSDIWSLGCILYELCAMEKMFDGTVSNVVLSIASGRKKTVNTKRYGQQMQEIIDLMLQINPDDRPDTKKIIALPDIFPTLYVLGTNLGCLE